MYKSVNNTQFSTRLKELRRKSGFKSAEDFATKYHLSINTYKEWESKDHTPTLNNLIYLAEIFGVSIDYLLGRIDTEHVENEDISKITGLSNTSIEILRFIREYKTPENLIDRSDTEGYNNRIVTCINELIEDSYDSVKKNKQRRIEGDSDYIYDVASIFTPIYEYIHSDLAKIENSDNERFLMMDILNHTTMASASELYREMIFRQLTNHLDYLREESGILTKGDFSAVFSEYNFKELEYGLTQQAFKHGSLYASVSYDFDLYGYFFKTANDIDQLFMEGCESIFIPRESSKAANKAKIRDTITNLLNNH